MYIYYYSVLVSYLTDRNVIFKYQNKKSTITPILAGVPQYSVLGPVLRELFIADILTYTRTHIYVRGRDNSILVKCIDPIIATQHVQENLSSIEQLWLNK